MRPTFAILFSGILVLGHPRWIRAEESNDTFWKGFSISCANEARDDDENGPVSCHGIRLVRKIVQKMLEETKKVKNLEILDGVSLEEKEEQALSSRNGRALKETFGPLAAVVRWFETRELRIKLPSLMPKNFEAAIRESLPSTDAGSGRGGGGGGGLGGGGKKGDNGYMLMALMMGKMMAAMGFGALALLAMKALMVSALALMLSLIVAAKKLAGGKEEEGHHIVYAQEVGSHHRKRRSIDDHWQNENFKNHPYRAYSLLPTVMS